MIRLTDGMAADANTVDWVPAEGTFQKGQENGHPHNIPQSSALTALHNVDDLIDAVDDTTAPPPPPGHFQLLGIGCDKQGKSTKGSTYTFAQLT